MDQERLEANQLKTLSMVWNELRKIVEEAERGGQPCNDIIDILTNVIKKVLLLEEKAMNTAIYEHNIKQLEGKQLLEGYQAKYFIAINESGQNK